MRDSPQFAMNATMALRRIDEKATSSILTRSSFLALTSGKSAPAFGGIAGSLKCGRGFWRTGLGWNATTLSDGFGELDSDGKPDGKPWK